MDVRREKRIREHLSPRLKERRRFSAVEKDYFFFCLSDLEEAWDIESRKEIFCELSEDQRTRIFERLILFVSFLILVEWTSHTWYSQCVNILFHDPASDSLVYTDEDGPRTAEQLLKMGIHSPWVYHAQNWQLQYRLRPAKITFDTEKWTQLVNSAQPLPFERTESTPNHQLTSTFDDPMGYDREFAPVRVRNYFLPSRML